MQATMQATMQVLTTCLAHFRQKYDESAAQFDPEENEQAFHEQAYAILICHIVRDVIRKIQDGVVLTPDVKHSIRIGWFDEFTVPYLIQDQKGRELLELL
jgi:hypothetical protein